MFKMIATAATAVLIAGTAIAGTATMSQPAEGRSFSLAGMDCSVFYMKSGDDFEVITTFVSSDMTGPVMRSRAKLADGESHVMEIGGFGAKAASSKMVLTRNGETVTAETFDGTKHAELVEE